MSKVRTQNGKLAGTVDSRTSALRIRDSKNTSMIEIPKVRVLLEKHGTSNLLKIDPKKVLHSTCGCGDTGRWVNARFYRSLNFETQEVIFQMRKELLL